MEQDTIQANLKFTSEVLKLTSFEESVQLPRKVQGQWDWGSQNFVIELENLFEAFISADSQQKHGLCQRCWKVILTNAFPEWSMLSLKDMLVGLCRYVWRIRLEANQGGNVKLNFIEFFAGSGNLSKACLQSKLQGLAFDIDYSEMHDMSDPSAVRLAVEALGHTVVKALIWLGTPYSSFTALCQNNSQRWERNMFMGNDPMVPFVAEGNHYMDVSAILFLVSFVAGNFPGFEQPAESTMPLAGPMALVLQRTGSTKCVTYGALFGASSEKPWQLWSTKAELIANMTRTRPRMNFSAEDSFAINGEKGEYTGKRHVLKQSQVYPMMMCKQLVQNYLQCIQPARKP
eukprot:Skav209689  [mRNA]  locus=scaffold2205:6026:7060:+ [translate_table: standard]